MGFWTIARITGWVSTIGGYMFAVVCIYRAAYSYARLSVAGNEVYETAGCVGNCRQQEAVPQDTVFTITILGAAILLATIYGIYKYMQPSLDHITELKAAKVNS